MKHLKKKTIHSISGLVEFDIDSFSDIRGDIWSLHETSIDMPNFVEDKVSISTRNVLRGLHGDNDTWKLITSLYGEFFLAVVDVRKDSQTYNKSITFMLNHKKPKVVLVPAGCLNGHLCLSDECVFFYKWSKKYSGPENQITARWDEPLYGIKWPIDNPILSERDKNAKFI